MNIQEIEKIWNDKAESLLKGKKIVDVRYMTEKERDMLGWQSRCVIIILDDGTSIYPSRDDEGNDAGALFVDNIENDLSETLPVI
jgi:hypothetical protein